MKGLLIAAGIPLASVSPAYAFQCDWWHPSDAELEAICSQPLGDQTDCEVHECLMRVRRIEAAVAAARNEAERKAALPHNDPGAVSLCPPPHRVTRDGCQ